MRVRLTRSKELSKDILESVYEILVSTPGPLEFSINHKIVNLGGEALVPLRWDEIFHACKIYREQRDYSDGEFFILLTGRKNVDNWFSSCDPSGALNIFIHGADWESYVSCPPKFPIAFQVIENILQRLMFDTLEEGVAHFHDPPIGCINDMCSWKPDVTFKVRTADVCCDCQRVIADKHLPEDLIRQSLLILENLRKEMLFFRGRDTSELIDNCFPFPIAITRRKMSSTTEPFRRFLMLLDHFDSLVRCTVISLSHLKMKDSFDDFFFTNSLHDRPSLGHWVSALQALSAEPYEAPVEIPLLPAQLLNNMKRVVLKAEEAGIVRLRNERRGHGYCDCRESTYQNLFEEYLPIVNEIEKMLKPMYTRITWCFTRSMRHISFKKFQFDVKYLTGDHPEFKEETIEIVSNDINSLPQTESVYIFLNPKSDWYLMSPHVLYCSCPACGNDRVLVSDGGKYLDPYVGHRVDL